MTNKAPAFQFYPKEYLSDYKVQRMDWETQGIYWSLLSHIWNDTETQYSIKNDPESIRKLFKLSRKKFEKVFKQIQWPDDSILKEEHGMLVSERLKKEKEKQEETRIKRQEAASKRWGKKESKSNASALQKECSAFASASASASASSTPKKKNPSGVKKTPDPKVKEFIIFAQTTFESLFKLPLQVDYKKDGALVKSLLKTYSLELLQGFWMQFINSKDDFILKAGKSIGVFKSQINKLISGGLTFTKDQQRTVDNLQAAQEYLDKGG